MAHNGLNIMFYFVNNFIRILIFNKITNSLIKTGILIQLMCQRYIIRLTKKNGLHLPNREN